MAVRHAWSCRALAVWVMAVLLAGCGGSGSDESDSPVFTLSLEARAVGAGAVELRVTANFGGSVPLWRDGHVIRNVAIEGGASVGYTDTGLNRGQRYCYQAGGHALLIGEVWSNVACATPS